MSRRQTRTPDPRKRREILARADGAAELLQHPLLETAHRSIRESIVNELEQLPPEDHAREHELVLMLKANAMHRATLMQWLSEGNALQAQEEQRQTAEGDDRFDRTQLM